MLKLWVSKSSIKLLVLKKNVVRTSAFSQFSTRVPPTDGRMSKRKKACYWAASRRKIIGTRICVCILFFKNSTVSHQASQTCWHPYPFGDWVINRKFSRRLQDPIWEPPSSTASFRRSLLSPASRRFPRALWRRWRWNIEWPCGSEFRPRCRSSTSGLGRRRFSKETPASRLDDFQRRRVKAKNPDGLVLKGWVKKANCAWVTELRR